MIKSDDEITWIGKLSHPDFRGWTVGQGNCVGITYNEDSRDNFRVNFVDGSYNLVPVDGFAIGFKPTPNRHKKRAAKAQA